MNIADSRSGMQKNCPGGCRPVPQKWNYNFPYIYSECGFPGCKQRREVSISNFEIFTPLSKTVLKAIKKVST